MKAVQWSFQRIEEKYLLTNQQYDRLRAALNERIEPDEYPKSTICNIYYDTSDYLLIRRSMDKPLYKEKFRLRSYGVPAPGSPAFMEIKKKYNGIVYKCGEHYGVYSKLDTEAFEMEDLKPFN